jgi:speckle-type POZ protein
MNCTVGVVKNHLETPKNIHIDVPPSDIGRCFKDLLRLRIGCDITFEVGDEQVQAHKWILATRSPVFKAQFFGPIGKADLDRVVVEDVEPIVFKVMFTFQFIEILILIVY